MPHDSLSPASRKRLWGVLAAALWLAAVLGYGLSLAIERTVVCDYVSVNGDFQSYNVFRRLLAGQTPYVDFANYIGMAPVFVNLPLVALLGGSFRDSLFATSFTSYLLFACASFLLVWLVTQQRLFAGIVSCATAKFISTWILCAVLGQRLGTIYTQRFLYFYTPSNSMRIARCFLPFLLVALALLYRRLAPKRVRLDLRQLLGSAPACAVVGGALGLLVTWSNDYTLACCAVTVVLFVLLHLFWYRSARRFLGCLAALAGAFLGGALLSAALVTGGHPGAWLASFRATGQYQFFYFNGCGNTPVVLYLLRCRDFWLWAAPFILYLLVQTVRIARRTLDELELPLYFLVACLLAGTMAYILAGSGYNCREPLECCTILFVLSWLARGAFALLRRHQTLLRGGMLAALALCSLYLAGQGALAAAGHTRTVPAGVYVEALEGRCTTPAALLSANEFTGDAAVFSVYATGLEVVKGQFQPTGYDYIIHALGEEVQQRYVADFVAGAYPFAQTPRMPLEGWLTAQNWYFYRELYRRYTPAAATEYSLLWRYSGDQTLRANVTLQVTQNKNGSCTITCTSSQPGEFIADLRVCYTTAFTGPAARLLNLGRKSVSVYTEPLLADDDTYAGLALPGDGEFFIPVVMKDGTGSVTICGQFKNSLSVTSLTAEYLAALPRHSLSEEGFCALP